MPDEEYKHGTFMWNELITRNMASAESFYTRLLGWKAIDSGMPGMKYIVFKAGEKEAGGMMNMPGDVPAEIPSHWMAYIAVDDVDVLVEKTKELGGKILRAPRDVAGVGRFCVIQDPAGAVISLITVSLR